MIEWKAGQTYEFAGLGAKAIEFGDRTIQIAKEQAFAFWVAMGTGCKGVGLKHQGRFEEAGDALRDCLSRLDATGSNILFPKYKGHLADALWHAGRREEAEKKLDEAFADQGGGELGMMAELLRFRGDFLSGSGQLDEAEKVYREALDASKRQNAKVYELRTTVHLCRLLQGRGQVTLRASSWSLSSTGSQRDSGCRPESSAGTCSSSYSLHGDAMANPMREFRGNCEAAESERSTPKLTQPGERV